MRRVSAENLRIAGPFGPCGTRGGGITGIPASEYIRQRGGASAQALALAYRRQVWNRPLGGQSPALRYR